MSGMNVLGVTHDMFRGDRQFFIERTTYLRYCSALWRQVALMRAIDGAERKRVEASVYAASRGREIGVSEWFELDQSRIDGFASVSEDFQFIHVSPERAAEGGLGGTIAHGFLSLSLLSAMAAQVLPIPAGQRFEVNYGFNKVRFLAPVRAGGRVRGRFTLAQLKPRRRGEVLVTVHVSVEIEGEDRPALVAEWLILSIAGAPESEALPSDQIIPSHESEY